MNINQIAIQLWTLRDYCQTAADLAATCKKLRAMGFSAIELGGLGPIPLPEVRSIADGEGLAITSMYVGIKEPEKAIQDLNTIGASYAMTSVGQCPAPADLDRWLADLEVAGPVFEKAGKTLCYHNHAHEFFRLDGKPFLQTIYERANPAYLQAELDTYWVQIGGGNPVQWCERLKNRLPLLHMKDFAVALDGTARFAEVGHGTLDFKAIVAAASECRWYIVEQDECYGNDPFDSVCKSIEYIKANLVG